MFWLGAAVSLCYIPGYTGAYIATQWPLLAVLLSFDLLRTAILPAVGVLPRQLFTVFHLTWIVFVVYAAARLPFSPVGLFGVFGAWLVVIMGLSLWFGSTIIDVRGLYKGLAVGAAISSFVAVLQYFGLDFIPRASPREAGIYVNGVQQATVFALLAVALVSERMWAWALPMLPGFLLAHSRGGVLVLAVGLLGCYVRSLWALGFLGVAGGFFLLSPLSGHDVQRLFIWQSAWDGLTWFGWGAGVFYSILLPEHVHERPFFPEYAHNDFLQLAFEYGVAAILPFCVFAYALWRTDAKEWPIVLAFCTAACFSMPLYMPVAMFIGLVAVGRVVRLHAMVGGYGDDSGRDFISSYGQRVALSRRTLVSVQPSYTAES